MLLRPLAGLFLILASCSSGQSETSKTKAALPLTGRVVDAANILDTEIEKQLTTKLAFAETHYGPQMVVVTTPSLAGRRIEDYAFELGNAWGIGNAKREDGLLLLIAPNERQVRIEVGYGLEGSFSDVFSKKILDEMILPKFSAGDLPAGIVAGVDRMIEKMKAVPTLPVNDNELPKTKEDAA
jgi:uncharacterized protein